jgi:hypothetical protein
VSDDFGLNVSVVPSRSGRGPELRAGVREVDALPHLLKTGDKPMRSKLLSILLFGLALTVTLNVHARPDGDRNDHDRGGDRDDRDRGGDRDHHDQECRISDHHDIDVNTPVTLVGVIVVPGNPIASSDIAWVDPATERYYMADRSNSGVDIIDAENDTWVGRVGGFLGGFPVTPASGGGTATSNGAGPNGVVVTPDKHLWAGDGNSVVQVADIDPSHVPGTYLSILATINTVWNNPANLAADSCDGGTATTKFCGRADELAFDPKDHIIFIGNPNALSTAAGHAPIPYGSFISSDPPYSALSVKGHVAFPGAGGLEQPVWDPELQRFVVPVPGLLNTAVVPNTVVTPPTIQILNPITMKSEETFTIDCNTITGGTTANNTAAGIGATGLALAPFQHFLVSSCGFPIIFTLNLKADTIHVINVVKNVGGGDEVWFNPGDDRYYVTGPLNGVTGNLQQLGVIDAEDGSFLQNVPEILGAPALPPVTVPATPVNLGKNPAAFPEQNRIFTVGQISAAIAAGTVPDFSPCAIFNVTKTGCIAVFTHESEAEEAEHNH